MDLWDCSPGVLLCPLIDFLFVFCRGLHLLSGPSSLHFSHFDPTSCHRSRECPPASYSSWRVLHQQDWVSKKVLRVHRQAKLAEGRTQPTWRLRLCFLNTFSQFPERSGQTDKRGPKRTQKCICVWIDALIGLKAQRAAFISSLVNMCEHLEEGETVSRWGEGGVGGRVAVQAITSSLQWLTLITPPLSPATAITQHMVRTSFSFISVTVARC